MPNILARIVDNLINRKVITKSEKEPWEVVKFQYKKFKMETIASTLPLIRPGMFMAKLDIKDTYYYSVPIN